MREVQFITPLHTSSKRDYLARMTAEKPECMRVAKRFDRDYWDGDRKYGYGGYSYDGRWKPVAEAMVKYYGLGAGNKIIDIGCGKAYLANELNRLEMETHGCDISEYAIYNTASNTRYSVQNCTNLLWRDNYFDFTYSINVFHNLGYKNLKQAIKEMVRISKDKSYICVESFRNEEELTNLQAWQLTCLSYYLPDDWLQIYEDCGYKGDCEFIYFT